jgi:nitrogen regulatory protein PII
MKLITAVVKPDKLDDVVRTVAENGGHGLTATEVMGFGQQFVRHGADARRDHSTHVVPEVRIDVVVHDELAEPLTEAIATAVNSGSVGDGKIWISPVESAVRVRTGERDSAAV